MSPVDWAKSLGRWLRVSHWVLIVILLLAFTLRLYGLDDVAIDNDESYDYHRWISVSFRAIMVDDLVLNNQTLAHISARGSILLLGNSLFALRWPSVCLSILSVALIYKMTARLFGKAAGVVSGLLLALSPYPIFFAHNFRGYMGVMMLPLLVYLLALVALETGQWRYWVALGLASVAMMYTHLFTTLAWLNLALFLGLVRWEGLGRLRKPSWPQLGVSFAITGLFLGVLYTPVWSKMVLAVMNPGQAKLTDFIWVQHPEVSASVWYNLWLFNGYWQKGSLTGQGVYVVLALVAVGSLIGVRQRAGAKVLLVLAWTFLPFLEIWLAGQIWPNFWVRPNYVSYTLPPLLMLAALAIAELPNYGVFKRLPAFGVMLVPVILLVIFWSAALREYYQVFAGADWQAIGNFLRRNSAQDDLIVCQRYPQPWREVDAELEDLCTRTLNYRAKADVKGFTTISTSFDLVFNLLPQTNTGVINRLGRVWLVLWHVPERPEIPPAHSANWLEFDHFGRAFVIQTDPHQSYVANLAEVLTAIRSTHQTPDQQYSYSLLIAPLAAASGNPEAAKAALDAAKLYQPNHPDSAAKLAAVEQLVAAYAELSIKNPLAVNFGDEIMLQGYDLNSPQLRPGSTLKLTLFWRALTQIRENYSIFVHLRDPAGHTVAQLDYQPFDGSYPTQNWQPGQSLSETRQWPIPADFPSGQYHLVLGLYNRDTLERLPLVDDQSGENAFDLTPLQVN